jgi:hypothetical protein
MILDTVFQESGWRNQNSDLVEPPGLQDCRRYVDIEGPGAGVARQD